VFADAELIALWVPQDNPGETRLAVFLFDRRIETLQSFGSRRPGFAPQVDVQAVLAASGLGNLLQADVDGRTFPAKEDELSP